MSDRLITLGRDHFEPKAGHGPSIDIGEVKRLFLAARKGCPAREGDSHPDLYLMAPFRLTVAEALVERLETAEQDRNCFREMAFEAAKLLESLESQLQEAKKQFAGLQSLYPALQDIDRDAERYRWLRAQQWDESDVFVVAGSKTKIRLGTYCPSGELLDSVVDAGRAKVNS